MLSDADFVLILYPSGSVVKNSPPMQEDALEEGMATHASVPAWRVPRAEEPGGLPSTGSQRVGHSCALRRARLHLNLVLLGTGNCVLS